MKSYSVLLQTPTTVYKADT